MALMRKGIFGLAFNTTPLALNGFVEVAFGGHVVLIPQSIYGVKDESVGGEIDRSY